MQFGRRYVQFLRNVFSLESQVKESHHHRFVEEDAARIFPCGLHAEALEAVVRATVKVRVHPHIRGFVACEAKTVYHSSSSLAVLNARSG